MDVIYAVINIKITGCVKIYIGCNIKEMYILVTILTTLRFFGKDEQIKTILILKDVMMNFIK